MKEYQNIYLAYKKFWNQNINNPSIEEILISTCLFLLSSYEDILYYPPYYENEICLLSICLNETEQLYLDNTGILYTINENDKHIIYDFCDYVTHINDPLYKQLYQKLFGLLSKNDIPQSFDNNDISLLSPEMIKNDIQSQHQRKIFNIEENEVLYKSDDNIWIDVIKIIYQYLQQYFNDRIKLLNVFIRQPLCITFKNHILSLNGRYLRFNDNQYKIVPLSYIHYSLNSE